MALFFIVVNQIPVGNICGHTPHGSIGILIGMLDDSVGYMHVWMVTSSKHYCCIALSYHKTRSMSLGFNEIPLGTEHDDHDGYDCSNSISLKIRQITYFLI